MRGAVVSRQGRRLQTPIGRLVLAGAAGVAIREADVVVRVVGDAVVDVQIVGALDPDLSQPGIAAGGWAPLPGHPARGAYVRLRATSGTLTLLALLAERPSDVPELLRGGTPGTAPLRDIDWTVHVVAWATRQRRFRAGTRTGPAHSA